MAKDFNDLEITITVTNKKEKRSEKSENFRFRHLLCRNMWIDSLTTLQKPLPKIRSNILSFVDDRLGIIQK